MSLSPPRPIGADDSADAFGSGSPSLDEWLRRRARANQASGASRTYVCCEGRTIVAYYALASGGVELAVASSRLRRNMPDPVPVVVLARLAVDRRFHAKGIGRALVRDASLRTLKAAEIIGVRGLLVHAISDDARAFYLAMGFEPSPLHAMTLMATLKDIQAAL
ncbi:MAG TPA: GNAT family N-acetyltransferase [Rhodoblastus sp.]|nr:GNAT family N-acetyltransferase [Rhodoblastus sp.]